MPTCRLPGPNQESMDTGWTQTCLVPIRFWRRARINNNAKNAKTLGGEPVRVGGGADRVLPLTEDHIEKGKGLQDVVLSVVGLRVDWRKR